MSLAASSSAERMEQLILLTERLTGLIAEQLRAFEARRPQDAAHNADETARLANLYRHESLKVKQDPKILEGAPPEAMRPAVGTPRVTVDPEPPAAETAPVCTVPWATT